jgi:hypothetical protein
MDTYLKDKIKFNVLGENTANKILNDLTPKLNKVFEDFKEGDAILKSGFNINDGELFKKYKDKTDDIIKNCVNKYKEYNPIIYLKSNSCFITIYIKLRFNDEKGFLYYDKIKYFINLDNGLFKELYDKDYIPFKQIDLNSQLRKFKKCLLLKEELNDIRTTLKPYSLGDLIK